MGIICWMKEHLLVNYVVNDGSLEDIETALIHEYKVVNISKNPYKLQYIEELRKRCVDIAHS